MAPSRGRGAKFALLLVAIVVVILEGIGFVTSKLLVRAGVMYRTLPVAHYASYLAERDPVLGWPSPGKRGQGEVDRSGSRLVPAFPDPALKSCVAVFGDSYTWGDEVGPADAYPNVLAKDIGCRVSNFGVGGYGTDQALLRYEQLEPEAPVVVLGHFSDNIIRNVNQERGFLTNEPFGLKPRFVDRDGTLDLIPLPSLTEEQYARVGQDAATLLPFDYFKPGGQAGVVARGFPYLLSAIRAFGHYRIRARLHGEPSYAAFYRPEHPSGALQVTTEIAERFVATAKSRGQAPLVVLIPDIKDLQSFRAHGTVAYQPLVDSLTKAGVPVVSAAAPLDAYLAGRPPCDLYFRCSSSHFRPEGYRELAHVVERALRDRKLLAAPSAAR
jgi:hypothetical protein